jgi:hypothetical protein
MAERGDDGRAYEEAMAAPDFSEWNQPSPNAAEEQFRQLVYAQGWYTNKRGWPDFVCVRAVQSGGGFMLVEVKPRPAPKGKAGMTDDQIMVLGWLASYGVPCFRWNPITGFEKIEMKRDP